MVYYLPVYYHYQIAALIFAIASITDWFDGFIARKLNQETNFGAFFDPIADKLIVVIALMLLLGEYNSYWITIPAIIVVSREIIISGLREWMARVGQSKVVSVMYLGKLKTTLQMVAIVVLLSQQPILSSNVVCIGILLLILASVLTVVSMVSYLHKAWPKLFK
jgi:CDP-diacylglycerol--glycerol-3-phosphate 3-phosphatidyltransferase